MKENGWVILRRLATAASLIMITDTIIYVAVELFSVSLGAMMILINIACMLFIVVAFVVVYITEGSEP